MSKIIAVFIFVALLSGQPVWEPLNGPPGGVGRCVLSDPIEDGMVWASVDSFLYLSINFGLTWQQIMPPQCIIYDIEIGQSNAQKFIFLATTEGILRSSDNGLSWQTVHIGSWNRLALKSSNLSSPANSQPVNIKIYNASGRLVRQWDYETIRQSDNISWNGTDENERPLPNGIYFIVLENGKNRLTQKLILLR